MTRLEELFPDGKRRSASSTVLDDHHTVRRLEQMLGDPRADLDVTHRASGRGDLVRLVNDAVADAKPLASSAPPVPGSRRRSRRRIDVVGAAAASLAVVALAALGVVGGIQAATADPADDALSVLAADEKTIEGVERALASGADELMQQAEAADARAVALRAALDTTRSAPDPADIPPGESEAPEDADTIAVFDEKALTTLIAEIDGFRADVAALEPPAAPEQYTRERIDEDSLTEVASAIDAAQQRLTELDGVTASMREARSALDARVEALRDQLAVFTATVPGTAEKVVGEHPDAEQDVKDALTDAAASLASADLMTDDGLAALTGYRDATVAVVSDQVRADREREEREREERERREREQSRDNPPAPAPEPTPEPTTEPTPPPPSDPLPDLGESGEAPQG